jgi:hypothetical protein
MPFIKISQLTTATAVSATNQLEINQNGASRSAEVSVLATYVRSSATNVLVLPAGSTAAPALFPTGDTNTGIFFPAADTIAFSEGGVEVMRIDSDGDVGIGTTTPTARLNVVAATTVDAVRITQTGTGNALVVEDATNPDSSPFVVDADGLVLAGISTNQASNLATGNARVQIAGGTAPLAFFRNADSATAINLEFAKRRATGGLLASGDVIGRLYFSGNDGVSAIPAAFIDAAVDGTPGVNDMPGRLVFSTTADGADTPTERMRIDASGDVGIGTSAPSGRVQINGLSGSVDVLRLTTAVDAAVQQEVGIGFGPGHVAQTNPAAAIRAVEFDASDSRASLTFLTRDSNTDAAPTERMRIDNAGQVQVGAGTAAAPALSTLTDTNTGIFFPAADTIAFTEGGVEGMRIDASGNVGIGTSSPGERLVLQGNTANVIAQLRNSSTANSTSKTTSVQFIGTDTVGTAKETGTIFVVPGDNNYTNSAMLFATRSGDAVSERMRIDASGLFLAGTTTSLNGHTFQAAGGADTYRTTTTAAFGIHHFYSDVGGFSLKAIVQADGAYANLSDARFKTDITPARSYLNDLMSVEVVTYRWKGSEDGGKRLGVIAQQVEQVFPSLVKEVVSNPDTGETQKMLPHEAFIPMLITAVQELTTKLEAAEARIATLEAR